MARSSISRRSRSDAVHLGDLSIAGFVDVHNLCGGQYFVGYLDERKAVMVATLGGIWVLLVLISVLNRVNS